MHWSFTWSVQYVLPGLFGCTKNGLNSTSMNQLQQAGIAINASNQWVGQVVVATDPPKGGISIQLPGIGAAPSLPVVGQLPGMSIAPQAAPTIGAGSLPGLGGSSAVVGWTNGTTEPNTFQQLPGSGVPGSFLDGAPGSLVTTSTGTDEPGVHVFPVR